MSVDMDTESEIEFFSTPPEMRAMVETLNNELLPTKSRERYKQTYITFKQWQESKKLKIMTENILLAYFSEMSEKLSPPTLWSNYSMLKSTIATNDSIDISQYHKLTAYLKRLSEGYKGKKSKVLTSEQINQFLSEAPDEIYLAAKVSKY